MFVSRVWLLWYKKTIIWNHPSIHPSIQTYWESIPSIRKKFRWVYPCGLELELVRVKLRTELGCWKVRGRSLWCSRPGRYWEPPRRCAYKSLKPPGLGISKTTSRDCSFAGGSGRLCLEYPSWTQDSTAFSVAMPGMSLALVWPFLRSGMELV